MRELLVAGLSLLGTAPLAGQPRGVVLLMADDLGWGDVSFGEEDPLHTPHLRAMARAGLRFERFYAAAPVCSPTRGSCLTGRHPYRYGIRWANDGHLPAAELTLAELLRQRGYATGHFGKWHLGTLSRTEKDSNRGGTQGAEHYAPPWEHGFEVCFSTEAKVPTWNPMRVPGADRPYGTAYWVGPGRRARKNLEGDDSRVIMDRVLPFVRDAVRADRPFFAVVWFHTPHRPVRSGPRWLALHPRGDPATRHYRGAISAMDAQIGRLRAELRRLGVARETLLWFCSDNGPEGAEGRAPGSTGGLRGRKRSLYEGGIRVSAVVEWPAGIAPGGVTAVPASTSDFLPTIAAVVGIEAPRDRAIDGISLLPWLRGEEAPRAEEIAFESGRQVALVGARFKLLGVPAGRSGRRYRLFDLAADPRETTDVSRRYPAVLDRMRVRLEAWRRDCRRSARRRAGRPSTGKPRGR